MPTPLEITDRVIAVVKGQQAARYVLEPAPEITAGSCLVDDLRLDELDLIDIAMRLEDDCGHMLPETHRTWHTVADIADWFGRHLEGED
jgi:acyl carrier protein